jgi:hypothetical protein
MRDTVECARDVEQQQTRHLALPYVPCCVDLLEDRVQSILGRSSFSPIHMCFWEDNLAHYQTAEPASQDCVYDRPDRVEKRNRSICFGSHVVALPRFAQHYCLEGAEVWETMSHT